MGSMSRGWALTRQSWQVLKSDASLVIFPILSSISGCIALAAIWAPTLLLRGVFEGHHHIDRHDPVFYAAGVVTAYVSTFIAIFFNVALAACAARAMNGEDTTVGQGFSAAFSRIGQILGWTFVTTTVGLILRALEDRVPFLGKIAAWIAGAAWAIATFFVVPVLALEGTGPVESLKRSSSVVKARWGEGVTGAATIAAATWVISFVLLIFGAAGAGALMVVNQPMLAIVVAAIAVAGMIIVSMISAALGQIFRVAVYQYAVSGQAPGGFEPQLLQQAFARR
jgi:hypothetical protein